MLRKGSSLAALCGMTLIPLTGCRSAEPDPAENREAAIDPAPILHIALQDTFEGVPVVVRIDGREVYREPEVLTDLRIGLADSFEVVKPDPPFVIQVALPGLGIEDSVRVELEGAVYVGVGYLNGALSFRVQNEPFGYV